MYYIFFATYIVVIMAFWLFECDRISAGDSLRNRLRPKHYAPIKWIYILISYISLIIGIVRAIHDMEIDLSYDILSDFLLYSPLLIFYCVLLGMYKILFI